MRTKQIELILGIGVLLAGACSMNSPTRTDGDAGPDAGAGGGTEADASSEGIGFDPESPNVMLLVDRSGSMAQPADCASTECPSRWEQLLGLGPYLQEVKQRARLGLALFPSEASGACGVGGSLRVPLTDAEDVDQQILGELMTAQPGGRTPAARALENIASVGDLDHPERDNVVVLLTDGRPNCECESGDTVCEQERAVEAVQDLVSRQPPIKLFIVGFGISSSDVAHETLTAMAQAAGHPAYYQAGTIEDLIARLYDIADETTDPCRFYLDELPEPDQLVAYIDGVEVPACTEEPCDEGYLYDQQEGVVDFVGSTCALLEDGQDHQVWFDRRDA